MPLLISSNFSEILQFSVSSTCFNYLDMFVMESSSKTDTVFNELFAEANKLSSVQTNIPEQITSWKYNVKIILIKNLI